jgi:hypothetical protein
MLQASANRNRHEIRSYLIIEPSVKRKLFSVALGVFSACISTTPARADSMFGILSQGQAGVNSIFPAQKWNTDVFSPVTLYASPVLGISNSFTIGASTFIERANASLTMNDGAMGGLANAFGSATGDATTVETQNAGGAASFSGVWFDTFFATGLPPGTPETFLFTNTLVSFVQTAGPGTILPVGTNFADVTGTLSVGTGSSELENSNGSGNSTLISSFIISTFSGAELPIELQFMGTAVATTQGLAGSASSEVLALDTSQFFITVLTPGASYTTASGVSYEEPESTPEPGSLWLVATALVRIWTARRRSIGRT